MHTFLEGGLCICIYTFVGCNLYLYPASVNADWEEHKITWLHLCCRKSLTMNSDKGGAGRAGDFCPKRCGGTVVDDNLCWGTPTKRDKKWVWSNSHFKTFQNTQWRKVKHTQRCKKCWGGTLHLKTHSGEKSSTYKSVCGPNHSTFDNTQWGKVKHGQKVWKVSVVRTSPLQTPFHAVSPNSHHRQPLLLRNNKDQAVSPCFLLYYTHNPQQLADYLNYAMPSNEKYKHDYATIYFSILVFTISSIFFLASIKDSPVEYMCSQV